VTNVLSSAHAASAPLVLKPASLSISTGGTLDLGNNELITTTDTTTVRLQLAGGMIRTSAGGALGYLGLPNGQVEVRDTLLGDSDLDGQVNVADLANLSGNFGQTSGMYWINGDFDYNGNVNVADLADLAGNFGASLSSSGSVVSNARPASASAVPEPVALAPVLIGVGRWATRRRRARFNRRK
jgi:hypothetical protein